MRTASLGSVVLPALHEREYECATLTRAVAAAAGGDGSILALEGEAGVGKTALLAHAARAASDQGMRVLHARGWQLECDCAYGVVRQLFEIVVAGATNDQRARWLPGVAGLAAAVVSGGAPVTSSSPDGGPILHGLYWLTANLACDGPLALLIDDAQWADHASLAFVSSLARSVDELPILIVCASRTGAGARDAKPALAVADLGAAPTVLRPAPLSERATRALLRERLSTAIPTPFARACHRATRGNPFGLSELARTLADEGVDPEDAPCVAPVTPMTIARSTAIRLTRLDAPARRLAAAVAVLGRRADLGRAAELAGLERDVAVDAADALAAAAILDGARPLAFVHPIVHAAVYASIAPGRRSAAHMQAACLLAQDGVDDVALAAHLLATEPVGDAWVVERLTRAAKDAGARGAGETAHTYLERALREPPPAHLRPHVLLALGSAELQLAKPVAVDHLREALHYASDAATRFAAAQELTWALWSGGRMPEAFAFGRQVLASLRTDNEQALRFEGRLAALEQLSPARARPALQVLERYEHRLVGETAGERLVLACLSSRAATRGQSAVTAADFALRALADGHLLRDDRLGAPSFLMAVGGLLYSDRLEEAEHHLAHALDAARAQGSAAAFAAAAGLRCQALLRRGRLAQAEAEALGAVAGVHREAQARPLLLASVVSAMVERSDPLIWEACLCEHGIDGDLADWPNAEILLLSRAQLRLAAGQAPAALRDLDELRRRDELSGFDPPWLASRACRALACLQLGRQEEAGTLAADELTRAGRWGTASALAGALRTMAIVRGGDEAVELLRAAVRAVEHAPARYELARCLAELGGALRRTGQPLEARQPLRRALDLAADCGALRLSRAVREELVAVGARPRRVAVPACHPLTPSERQIAQLAAQGRANRDIAQALFVTVRTVERHLSHIYAKLDVVSPHHLAAALHA